MKKPKRIRRLAVRVTDELHEQLVEVAGGAPPFTNRHRRLAAVDFADALLRGARQ